MGKSRDYIQESQEMVNKFLSLVDVAKLADTNVTEFQIIKEPISDNIKESVERLSHGIVGCALYGKKPKNPWEYLGCPMISINGFYAQKGRYPNHADKFTIIHDGVYFSLRGDYLEAHINIEIV